MEFSEFRAGELLYLAAPGLNQGRAVHGFSTRLGGVSEGAYASLNLGVNRGDDPDRVRENFSRFSRAVGLDPDKLVFSRQEHRDLIRNVTAADAGKGLSRPVDYEADALVTDVPGLGLVIFTADCIPVLLHDPVRGVVGACHAGWRGTALGIVEKTVSRMARDYGCRPADIRAAIGPGIAQCCFETTGDVPEAMTAALGDGAEPFIRPGWEGHFQVDLKGLNRLWLTRAGVPEGQIAVSGDCTACRGDRYWSHRILGARRGSMASAIRLLPEENATNQLG